MSIKPNSLTTIAMIPTYNEAGNIERLITQILKLNDSIGCVIVDDNSPDGTKDAVLNLKKKFPNLNLLLRDKKEGIGAALRAGYNIAKGEYILSSDTDLSFKVSDMEKLYDKLDSGYDLVVGSRYAQGGYYEKKNTRTIMKGFVSYFGNKFFSFVFGIPVSDFSASTQSAKR